MRVTIKNVGGAAWSGRDFDGTEVTIRPGETAEVSEKRAELMIADYPRLFQRVDEPEATTTHVQAPSSGGASSEVASAPTPPSRRKVTRRRGGR